MADTAVARAGQPGMGVASCFGSPLLNDVLGFSVALIVRAVVSPFYFVTCLTRYILHLSIYSTTVLSSKESLPQFVNGYEPTSSAYVRI